jgi:hypothetical protein
MEQKMKRIEGLMLYYNKMDEIYSKHYKIYSMMENTNKNKHILHDELDKLLCQMEECLDEIKKLTEEIK